MTIEYKPQGICARNMRVTVEAGIVRDAVIEGGCDGNHKGIISLIKGMKAEDAAERMRGIRCGMRPSSCPDQLAIAIAACAEAEKKQA